MMRFVIGYVGTGSSPLQRLRTLVARMPLILRESGHVIAAECEVAQNLASLPGMSPSIQAAPGQAFERWDGTGLPGHIKGDDIPLSLRLVQSIQDIGVFHRIGGPDAAVAIAQQRAGGAYDPGLVARFCQKAVDLCEVLDAGACPTAMLSMPSWPQPAIASGQPAASV